MTDRGVPLSRGQRRERCDGMEYLIFSDSHGRLHAMREALARQITTPDGILFLGDGLRDADALDDGSFPMYTVQGNCDWFTAFSDACREQVLTLGGCRILMTHGHDYGVKSGYGALLRRAVELDVDVALFGHTHVPLCESFAAGTEIAGRVLSRPLYLFNPGSIGADGSFGCLTVRLGKILLSHGNL